MPSAATTTTAESRVSETPPPRGKRFGDFNYEEQGDILRDYYRKRELGEYISAYQPFVDQVRFGTTDGLYPEPTPPPGPVV